MNNRRVSTAFFSSKSMLFLLGALRVQGIPSYFRWLQEKEKKPRPRRAPAPKRKEPPSRCTSQVLSADFIYGLVSSSLFCWIFFSSFSTHDQSLLLTSNNFSTLKLFQYLTRSRVALRCAGRPPPCNCWFYSGLVCFSIAGSDRNLPL